MRFYLQPYLVIVVVFEKINFLLKLCFVNALKLKNFTRGFNFVNEIIRRICYGRFEHECLKKGKLNRRKLNNYFDKVLSIQYNLLIFFSELSQIKIIFHSKWWVLKSCPQVKFYIEFDEIMSQYESTRQHHTFLIAVLVLLRFLVTRLLFIAENYCHCLF